jgi:3-methyladenine DNA glycosylase AlkD
MNLTINVHAQILNFIRAHRNGETAGMMNKRGIQYNMNYGVSIIHIRQYAKELGYNHQIAQKLWKENMRETKLFALYLFDPKLITEDDLNEIILQINNTELAEQASFSILTNAVIPQNMLMEWCQNSSQAVKLTAYSTINRKFKTNTMIEFDFGLFFDVLYHEIAQDFILPTKSISFALSEIARKGHTDKIETFLKKLETINTKQSIFIVDCVKNEMNMNNI